MSVSDNRGSKSRTKIVVRGADGHEEVRPFRYPTKGQADRRLRQMDEAEADRALSYVDLARAFDPGYVDGQLRKAADAKARLEAQTYQPRRELLPQTGEPTREAERHASYSRELVKPPGEPLLLRSRRDAPIHSPDARAMILFEADGSKKTGKLTGLEQAAYEAELVALWRATLCLLALDGKIKIGNYGGQPRAQNAGEKPPISPVEQREMRAFRYVWRRLPEAYQGEMVYFRDLCFESARAQANRTDPVLTPVDFGKQQTASSDPRVGRGGFIVNFRKIGQLLSHSYMEWEIGELRRRVYAEDEARAAKRQHEMAAQDKNAHFPKKIQLST